MIRNQNVTRAFLDWLAPVESENDVSFNTLHVYPSNGVAKISVQPMMDKFILSDLGGAYNCVTSSGNIDQDILKALSSFLKGTGMNVSQDGSICMSDVKMESLTAAASVLAETSVEASKHIIKKLRPIYRVDFRPELRKWVEERFKSKFQHNTRLAGASNKEHRFDYQIRIGEQTVLIDAVRPDHNSIASKVLAHMDVANKHDRAISQAIVYHNDDQWDAADLNLLRVGAKPVEFGWIDNFMNNISA